MARVERLDQGHRGRRKPACDRHAQNWHCRMVRTHDRDCSLRWILRQSAPPVRVVHRRERIELTWIPNEEMSVGKTRNAKVVGGVCLVRLVDEQETEARSEVAAGMGITKLVQRADDDWVVMSVTGPN